MLQKNYNTKVLLRKGIMDERGSGILRIEEAMEKWELEKPDYAEKDGYFVITFKGPGRAEKPLDEEILKNLNERQKKALNYIKDKGRITNKEYREINKIGSRYTIKELNNLIDNGIITKKGKGRSIHYVLVRD